MRASLASTQVFNAGVQHVFHEMAGSALDTAVEPAPVRHDEGIYFAMVRERVAALEMLFPKGPLFPGAREDGAWDREPKKRNEEE